MAGSLEARTGRMTRRVANNSFVIRKRVRGYSMDKLSELSGIPAVALSRIEGGERTVTVDEAVRIAEALEVPPETFLFRNAFYLRGYHEPQWESPGSRID